MRLLNVWFYVAIAVITLVAVAIGFGRTYAAQPVGDDSKEDSVATAHFSSTRRF